MSLNKKTLFNFFSYILFLFVNKILEILGLNQKNFYEKPEYSTFYSYKKKC